ncbi:hypothetical protein CROQUDRAFT_656861 [Cronartium quercuum f. sp. fusiforme G11]|uniref:Peroxisomal membrane protein PEX14 n=1 Tax=Cronartium quercuum f. sp. fusiforme G11 TaxID=708437 RepID=A0A9P6NMQ1_9BASI|nr:hypothetical protein CROQUDRAFT_656861 [Cronartium quercuum f. sp. fusiforme G11]
MTGSITLREPLIYSAVSFLQDPAVSDAPLAKRLAFLESKGLSPSETDEALRRAASLRNTTPFGKVGQSGYYHSPHSQELSRDWRDWFIMSVIGGGFGCLAISLAKKFLLPALKPPTQSELEEAQARLEEKYDEAAKILEAIQTDTNAIKQDLEQQGQRLDESIKVVESAVDDCLAGETRRDEEIQKIESDVKQLKSTIIRMLEKNSESQTRMIIDLRNELKSLKSLLAARTPPPPTFNSTAANESHLPTSSSSTISRFGTNRPVGIPAWQLAATTSSINNSNPHHTDPSTSFTATASSPTQSIPNSSVPLDSTSEQKTNISISSTTNGVSRSKIPFDEDDDQDTNQGSDQNHGQEMNGNEQATNLIS